MSTSIWDGRVRFSKPDFASEDPMSTALSLVQLNNVLHHADMAGQVRAAWRGLSGEYRTISGSTPNDTWAPIELFPIVMTIGSDGMPYLLRVNITMAASTGGTTTGIRVKVCRFNSHKTDIERADERFVDASSSSTTPSETAGTIAMTADGTDVDGYFLRSEPTVESVGGAGVSVPVHLGMLAVYGKSATVASAVPHLLGIHVSEYIGT